MTESCSLRRRSGVGLAALLATVALAGCGGTAGTGDSAPTGPIRIALREYHLTPATIDVHSGSVTFQVTNDGRLPHNLVVTGPDGTRAAKSDPIAPGASATLDATLTAGTYTLSSTLLSDKALGVTGTLHVG
jgi:hypothetical protein